MKTISLSMLVIVSLTASVNPAGSSQDPCQHGDVAWWKFDEYGNLPFGKEKARLKEFILRLRADRNMTGYIVAYAGRQACVGEAHTRANRVTNYLHRTGGIRLARLKTLDAGYRQKWWIELYVGPPGLVSQMKAVIPDTHRDLPRQDVRILKCKGKLQD